MLRAASRIRPRINVQHSARSILSTTSRANAGLVTVGRRAASTVPPPPAPSSGSGGSSTLLVAMASLLAGAAGGAYYTTSTSDSPSEKSKYGTKEDFAKAIKELQEQIGGEDKVSTDPDVLELHGFSPNHHHPGVPHSVVIFAHSTDDVVKAVKIANKYRMPVVPFSGGTSLEGHFSGYKDGCMCISMHEMNNILEIHEEDADLVVQSGASWEEINSSLKEKGIPLFFPLDPGPGATIGGMVGTGCSGTNAVKYGTARSHWFLNLTVVLPNGEVIKTRSRARKSSAGPDMTKLFIGAEGTLGIVTEATIRLAPVLPTSVAVAAFPTVKHATSAVAEALNSTAGDSLRCIELVDDQFMITTNKFGTSSYKYVEKDSLFIKFQGSPESIKENAKIVEKIVKKHGGLTFDLARSPEQAEELWHDRKNALWTGLASYPGAKAWSTDVCVPVSKLPELVYETKKDLAELKLRSTIVGHVGDGNFHALLLFKEDELEAAKEAVHRMVERAQKLEGTCTGEHGVGLGKRDYLIDELGIGTVELMKTVKNAVDPLGIMNPGKLYPDTPKDGKPSNGHH